MRSTVEFKPVGVFNLFALIITVIGVFFAWRQLGLAVDQVRPQKIMQAWSVISSAERRTGDNGRVFALGALLAERESIRKIDLSKAFLHGIVKDEIDFSQVQFVGADIEDMACGGCNFSLTNFSGATIKDSRFGITKGGKSRSNFDNAKFSRALMENVTFDDVVLWAATLKEATLHNVRFINASDASGIDLSRAKGTNIIFSGGSLRAADFSHSELMSVCFDRIQTDRTTNFAGAELYRADFQNSYLNSVDFNAAVLWGARFDGVTLHQVNFENADLRYTSFRIANDVSNLTPKRTAAAWKQAIRSISGARIGHMRGAPDGFRAWALSHGAVEERSAESNSEIDDAHICQQWVAKRDDHHGVR